MRSKRKPKNNYRVKAAEIQWKNRGLISAPRFFTYHKKNIFTALAL